MIAVARTPVPDRQLALDPFWVEQGCHGMAIGNLHQRNLDQSARLRDMQLSRHPQPVFVSGGLLGLRVVL